MGNKALMVYGSAPCGEIDRAALETILNEFDVMAIGLDCPYEGHIHFFATYHFLDIPVYKMKRDHFKGNMDFKVIGHKHRPEIDIFEEHKEPSGSSTLLGVVAAIKLGYTKIILCGCPMEGDNKKYGSTPYNHFQKGWISRLSEIYLHTRSMSGFTKQILGHPTKEWVES